MLLLIHVCICIWTQVFKLKNSWRGRSVDEGLNSDYFDLEERGSFDPQFKQNSSKGIFLLQAHKPSFSPSRVPRCDCPCPGVWWDEGWDLRHPGSLCTRADWQNHWIHLRMSHRRMQQRLGELGKNCSTQFNPSHFGSPSRLAFVFQIEIIYWPYKMYPTNKEFPYSWLRLESSCLGRRLDRIFVSMSPVTTLIRCREE